jgi:hypothetical protein
VFSFFEQRIRFLGIVQRAAISASKPPEFGTAGAYWNTEGWYVAVRWHHVPDPVHPKSLLDELRAHMPSKYSPLNRETGDGLQNVYLAAVPDSMAQVLLGKMGKFRYQVPALAQETGDDSAVEYLEATLEQSIKNDTTIDSTEKQAVVLARRGQGKYRNNLEQVETRCRITGVSDRRLLRASHIKPWRSCETHQERLDGRNGLLLAPHIDHLFDRGYISFSDDGAVLVSPRIDPKQLQMLGLPTDPPPNVGTFGPEQRSYLEHHRSNVFIGKVDG